MLLNMFCLVIIIRQLALQMYNYLFNFQTFYELFFGMVFKTSLFASDVALGVSLLSLNTQD